MAVKIQLLRGIIATALLMGMAFPALAGWVQTERDGTKTLISDGKVKELPAEPDEGWLVMDHRGRKVLVFNPEQNTCSEATFSQYCETIEILTAAHQKALAAFEGDEEGHSPPAVEIKKRGSGGKIAGFETTKYQVYADGELYEELWLTTDKAVLSEVGDQSSLQDLFRCLHESEVEGNPAYFKMMISGWPLKTLSQEAGLMEVYTDVVTLIKTEIPPADLALPPSCRSVPLQESMENM